MSGAKIMTNDGYTIKMNEDFGPVPNYKPYLMLFTVAIMALVWLCCVAWALIPVFTTGEWPMFTVPIVFAILAAMIVFGIIWSRLYFGTVQYHMNDNEITWKRGVWFHSTGIVPYNRMTDVNIVQGPVMRKFGISHLRIQTAGTSSNKVAEISIEGMNRAEELRAVIIDHMRGKTVAGGATVGVVEEPTTDISELLSEVKEIRKLLESK